MNEQLCCTDHCLHEYRIHATIHTSQTYVITSHLSSRPTLAELGKPASLLAPRFVEHGAVFMLVLLYPILSYSPILSPSPLLLLLGENLHLLTFCKLSAAQFSGSIWHHLKHKIEPVTILRQGLPLELAILLLTPATSYRSFPQISQ